MRISLLFLCLFYVVFIKAQIDSINLLSPAAVRAVTSDQRSPFTHSDFKAEDLNKRDASQDLPFLLRLAPSVVVTSDAGNGIGYTGIRIRGTDASRINVTINGVPLNDAESQGVYWVNLPDLGASVSGLQIQRGVGTSSVGASAFGASIAINTLGSVVKPKVKVVLGMGSFNSKRESVSWSTGMLGEGFSFDGRVSHISSDGFIDRASSELNSLYTSIAKRWDRGRMIFTTMLGNERTYQAWFGVPQIVTEQSVSDNHILDWAAGSYEYGYGSDTVRILDLLENRRTHNYYNYENEVDDYAQNHLQLHIDQRIGLADLSMTIYSTAGSGFYEQYKERDSFSSYGLLTPMLSDSSFLESTNVIRRRWLDNQLFGGLFNFSIDLDEVELEMGCAYSTYCGDHFGEIMWMEYALEIMPETRYYDNLGDKRDMSAYSRLSYDLIAEIIKVQGEVNIRSVLYASNGVDSDLQNFQFNDNMFFFNPKLGLDYQPSLNSRAFASVAVANREPARSDYIDHPIWSSSFIKPERLLNLEAGYKRSGKKWAAEIGLYHMDYKDQLIATGALNDVGNVIRINVPNSYRQGVELQGGIEISDNVRWDGNLTLSKNKITEFNEILYDYISEIPTTTSSTHMNTEIAFSPAVVAASILDVLVWSNDKSKINCELATKSVGKQYLDNTSNEGRSLPEYLVNDIVIRWSPESESGLSVSVFANNIFNELYSANGWTYSYLYGGLDGMVTENYVFPQAGRHGFINIVYSF
ncbi:TonB-dependent receptor [Flavobacteriales bacterium]|nr:TonB-dependent receptor [Flavobacteriales bacterium]